MQQQKQQQQQKIIQSWPQPTTPDTTNLPQQQGLDAGNVNPGFFPNYCGTETDLSPREYIQLFNDWAIEADMPEDVKKCQFFCAIEGEGKPFLWKLEKEEYFFDRIVPWQIIEAWFIRDMESILGSDISAVQSSTPVIESNSDHTTTTPIPSSELPALDFTLDQIGTNTGNTETIASAESIEVDGGQTLSTPQPVDNTNTYPIPTPVFPVDHEDDDIIVAQHVSCYISSFIPTSTGNGIQYMMVPMDQYEKLLAFYESNFKKTTLADGGRNTLSTSATVCSSSLPPTNLRNKRKDNVLGKFSRSNPGNA